MNNRKVLFYLTVIFTVLLYLSLSVTCAAPQNDNFSNAASLAGDNGTTASTNIDATAESGEPNHGDGGSSTAYSSVWFSWTAPYSGEIFFSTEGSVFDTTMAAYSGSAVDSLTKLVDNDDISTDNYQSRIGFTAVAGTTYSIAVDGWDEAEEGSIVLIWFPPSANDDFAGAVILSGSTGENEAHNLGATAETGEPNHGDDGGDGATAHSSIWFSWTAPSSGEVYFNTFGSDFDTTLAAYTGAAVDSLTKLADNDDFGPGVQSLISFTAITGTTYHVAVDGWDDVEQGSVVLGWFTPATNDNFVDAVVLVGSNGTKNAHNVNTTAETGEPNHGDGNSPSANVSIWFSWIAPFSGEIFFNTIGSSFDTTLAAYTGTAINSLTKVVENDNNGIASYSVIGFTATAGTTYSIAVDGYDDSEQGKVVLSWDSPPANDNFMDATTLLGNSGMVYGHNFGATAQPGEPNHGGSSSPSAYVSIWYRWTATSSGEVFFNTFGSNFDTTLAAYGGTALDNLSKLAENDDSGSDYQSKISFTVVAGTTYSIAVDGYDETERGNVVLSFDFVAKKFPWPVFIPAIVGHSK